MVDGKSRLQVRACIERNNEYSTVAVPRREAESYCRLRFSAYLGLSSPSGGLCSFVNELTNPNGIEGSKEWAALSIAVKNQERS